MTEEHSIYNCGTCENNGCDFNPNNPEAYFMVLPDEKRILPDEKRMYPGIEIVHEFTLIKGCSRHSEFVAPLDRIEAEIKGGQAKYQELIDAGGNGLTYMLAWKALQVCLDRIKKHRGG